MNWDRLEGEWKQRSPIETPEVIVRKRGPLVHEGKMQRRACPGQEAQMSIVRNPTAPNPPGDRRDEDAVFKGWQQTGSGRVFPLFTITAADHPSRGSTVSGKTLQRLNLGVPDTPASEGSGDEQQGRYTNAR